MIATPHFDHGSKNAGIDDMIQKATHEFGAKKITLGVFDNNPSAFHCYESVGFKVIGTDSYLIDGEEWTEKEMEITIGL